MPRFLATPPLPRLFQSVVRSMVLTMGVVAVEPETAPSSVMLVGPSSACASRTPLPLSPRGFHTTNSRTYWAVGRFRLNQALLTLAVRAEPGHTQLVPPTPTNALACRDSAPRKSNHCWVAAPRG